jgi:thiamine-phosphate pyrophosphorylase
VITNNEEKRETLKSPFFYTYLITDPKYYGEDIKSFGKTLSTILENFSIDMVCFRDKQTKNIKSLAKCCLEVSKQYGIQRVLLNGDIQLAKELGFDGVHLTSRQFDQIIQAKSANLYTMISTHSEEEIKSAKEKQADGVTFSSIFFKENKGEPKGCEILQKMVYEYQSDYFAIFALGGITTPKEVEQVKKTHAKGFASISYFFHGFNLNSDKIQHVKNEPY